MADHMGTSIIGLAWYKRADYPRIREIMVDRESLETTFDKWQGIAKKAERQFQRRGDRVIRAYIDPERFVDWCAANGMDANSQARARWASEVAHGRTPGAKTS